MIKIQVKMLPLKQTVLEMALGAAHSATLPLEHSTHNYSAEKAVPEQGQFSQ